ncbi:MAG TPA: CPBP family intramembrane metalloprotease [Nitrospiria bacterium]|nr:CPBP family intramembrane metalloprotease [Candidatus Manganitrophaceae bacterium]HIL35760.1 CPBP family intramembrane metalloprotease [Candidatus Manganitrophaceae bacterium]
MVLRKDLLFILVFWSIGYFIFTRKDRFKDQDTLFDQQHWEVWTGILSVSILIFFPSLSTEILSLFRLEFNPVYYFLLRVFILFSIVLLYHFSTRQSVRIFGSKWAFGVLLIGGVLGYFFLNLPLVSRNFALRISQAQQQGIINALVTLFESQLGAWSLWMPILLIVILAPLVEELVFRGMLYSPIRKRFGPPKAMLITGVLFSIFHRVPELRSMMAFF